MPSSCRSFLEQRCGVDMDDIFVFTVPKAVKIREARLGVLYYLFVAGIAFYIVIWQLILNHSYLTFKPILPSVRLTVFQSTVNSCNPSSNSCLDELPQMATLPYCCNSSCTNWDNGTCTCPWRPSFPTYECSYVDGLAASVIHGNDVLVTTFLKEYTQEQNASCGFLGCSKMWYNTAERTAVVPGIERYTLAIDHSAAQPELHISRTATEMRGRLAVEGTSPAQRALCRSRPDALTEPVDGRPTQDAPCYIRPDSTAEGLDIFRIGTLLQAMDISLDPEGDPEAANQYRGLTVKLGIRYFNAYPMKIGELEPQYIYQLVPMVTPYKRIELVWKDFPRLRVRRDMRGLLISVIPFGEFGSFFFQQLLLTVTASLTLVAIAAAAVQHLALYVLRHRKYYKHLMYQTSADFTDVRQLEVLGDVELQDILEQRRLPQGGTREQWILRILEDTNGLSNTLRLSSRTPLTLTCTQGSGVSVQLGPLDRKRADADE